MFDAFSSWHARKNSTETLEDLRAKSKQQPCERYLTIDECKRLASALTGRNHLIVRLAFQCGLRPEEIFCLRIDDAQWDQLQIDEALVQGRVEKTKTPASDAFVYLPLDMRKLLHRWVEASSGNPRDFLFQPGVGRKGFMNANNFRKRVLKPAAIRAGVGLIDTGNKDKHGNPIFTTDVDFRCLRIGF